MSDYEKQVVTSKKDFKYVRKQSKKTRRISGNKTSQNERIYHKKTSPYSLAGQIRYKKRNYTTDQKRYAYGNNRSPIEYVARSNSRGTQ